MKKLFALLLVVLGIQFFNSFTPNIKFNDQKVTNVQTADDCCGDTDVGDDEGEG